MQDTSRYQYFVAWSRPQYLSVDFKLNVAFYDHYQFVDRMAVIFPLLARRIGPDVTAETTRPPVGSYGFYVHGTQCIGFILDVLVRETMDDPQWEKLR
jgi:hypothetical protein